MTELLPYLAANSDMEYRTKEEQVADFLREGIIAGRFERGSRLKQVDIAKMLNISVTPVREALKLLEAEGYVRSDSHRGSTVAAFDATRSEEIIGLRIMLESHLVGRAVERIDARLLAEIKDLSSQFDAAVERGDRHLTRGINYRLHRAIYAAADLPQTLNFVQILWARYPFDVVNALPGRPSRACGEHAQLIRAIGARDISGAIFATRRHIESGWAELQAELGQVPGESPPSATLKGR
jgi:DNA-binding GntR family transcriptional regulator